MTSLALPTTVLFALTLTLLPTIAPAWGRSGHQIIAAIAESRLTTSTLEQVHAIMGSQEPLAAVSTWADAVRRDRKETAPWHYVNIRIGTDGYDPAKCPNDDCVTAVIPELAQLITSDPETSATLRRERLMYLIHFVGDQSQPLHNANEDDEGGNRKKVEFFTKSANLHSIWDSQILGRYQLQSAQTDAQLLERLNSEIRPEQIRLWARGTAIDWTMDSHRVGVEFAYPGWSETITTDYYVKSVGTVRVQLQKGGVRLAHQLNSMFDERYDGTLPRLRASSLAEDAPDAAAAPFNRLRESQPTQASSEPSTRDTPPPTSAKPSPP